MRIDRVVFLLALFLCLPAFAQTTGAIEGVVTDPSGAAIPGAHIKVSDTGTGVESATVTNSSGYFSVEGLAVGVYDLEVTQAGFKTYSVKGLIVDVTARVKREVRLEV